MNHASKTLLFPLLGMVLGLPVSPCLSQDQEAEEAATVQTNIFDQQRKIANDDSNANPNSRRKRAIEILRGIATGNFSNVQPSANSDNLATQAAKVFGELADDAPVAEDAITSLGEVVSEKPEDLAKLETNIKRLTALTESASLRNQVAAASAIKTLLDGHDVSTSPTRLGFYVDAASTVVQNDAINMGVRSALVKALIAKGDQIVAAEAGSKSSVLEAAKKKAESAKTTAESAATALLDATAQRNEAQDSVDNGGLRGDALRAARIELEKLKIVQSQAEAANTKAAEALATANAEVTRIGKIKKPNEAALRIVAKALGEIVKPNGVPASIAVPISTALAKFLEAMASPVGTLD